MYRSIRQFLIAFLPSALWYGVLWWLSSQSKLPGPGDQGLRDFLWFKTAHVLSYAWLTFLVWGGTLVWKKKMFRRSAWVFGCIVMLAIIDELHQATVPGRHPKLTDVFIDSFASVAVLFALERYNAFHSLARKWFKTLGM